MEKTHPPRSDEVGRLDEVERLALAERERRIDEAVERGEAVRVPLNVVCGAEDDVEAARVREQADKVSELRRAGEQRKPVFDEQVILTGVPRPGRDDRYAERLRAERAQQTIEQRQQEEAEAAKLVEAYHEGSRSHEPEPPPAPLPKSVIASPPSDLQWTGVVVPISGPSAANPAGRAVEGRFGVADFILFVADAEGRLLTSRVLQPGDDPKAIARVVLRERHKKGGAFWSTLDYPRARLI
jgi:hypothetical protein